LTDDPVDAVTFVGRSPVVATRRARVRYDERGVAVDSRDTPSRTRALNGTAALSADGEVSVPGRTSRLDAAISRPRVAVASTRDGGRLLIALDGRAWLWDLANPRGALDVATIAPELDGDAVASLLATGALVLSSGDLRVWDPDSDALTVLPGGPAPRGRVTAVSPDQRAFFRAGGPQGQLGTLWRLASGAPPIALAIPDFPRGGAVEQVVDAAFSRSGALLVTGSANGAARIWSAATGQQLVRIEHPAPIARVAVYDGGRVVTADRANRDRFLPWPRLWTLPAGGRGRGRARLERLLGQELSAIGAAGSRLLIDGWVTDGEGRRLWRSPVATGAAVAFSADGERLAVADRDRLHIAAGGEEVDHIELEGAPLVEVAFQGRAILRAVDADGIVHFWRSCDRDPACRAAAPVEICRIITTGDGWIAIDASGRYDTSDFRALGRLAWVMSDQPLTALPADLFIRDYYVPGLVPRLLAAATPGHAGDPPLAAAPDLARVDRRVPVVAIDAISPVPCARAGDACAVPRAKVTLTVTVAAEPGHTRDAYDVRLLRDGNLATEWPEAHPGGDLAHWREAARIALDESGRRTLQVEVPLAASRSTAGFSAYAFNEDRLKGPTASATYHYAPPAAPARPRAFVLAIGVGPSGPGLDPLTWPPVDAMAATRLFADGLGAAYTVVPVSLVSATPRWREAGEPCTLRRRVLAPTKAAVRGVLAALADTAPFPDAAPGAEAREIDLPCWASGPPARALPPVAPDDAVFVYVSAHGSADGGEFSVVAEGGDRISSRELADWLRPLASDHIVVILDTCDSEAAVTAQGFRPGPLGDFTFGQLAYDKAMQILTATEQHRDAIDSPRLGGSLLVRSLRDRVARAGRQGLPVAELLRSTVHAVPALFHQLAIEGDVQRPVMFDYRTGRTDVVVTAR
jgi:hypothetical protein